MCSSRSTLVACNTKETQLRFLILNSPTPSTLPEYLEDLRSNGVRNLVRVCQKTYDDKAVEKAGIRVHEWQIPDGYPPKKEVISEWLSLVEKASGISALGGRKRNVRIGAGGSAERNPGLIQEPQVYPFCPQTREECRPMRIEEGEPDLHTCSGCKTQIAAGDSFWRCDASSFNVCRKCKDAQKRQLTVELTAKRGSAEETLGVRLLGLQVVDLLDGAAQAAGVEKWYMVHMLGDVVVDDAADLATAFSSAKAPFTVTFQVDYLLPCIGVHCIAGLGRAPVLVAVALVELAGVEAPEALLYIRERRNGCFNSDQVKWLLNYKKKKPGGPGCCGVM